jgi:hypothetical protein
MRVEIYYKNNFFSFPSAVAGVGGDSPNGACDHVVRGKVRTRLFRVVAEFNSPKLGRNLF